MKQRIFSLVCVPLLLIACALPVLAQKNTMMVKPRPVAISTEWKPHFGLLIGAAQPESTGITATEAGIEVGYQPYIPFGLAVEFNHSGINSGKGASDRNTFWAKGNYNFGGTTFVLKNSYVGLGLGAVFKPGGTSMALAPLVGFDIPIKEERESYFSLGASMKYAVISDNEVDTMTLSGAIKYWY